MSISIFRTVLFFLLAFTLCAFVAPQIAVSQNASEVLEKIKERAKAWNEVVSIIRSDGPTELRVAAFEEAVTSGDNQLRLSAMDAALSAKDGRLRKSALRVFLHERPELRFEFIQPDNASKAQKWAFAEYQALRLGPVNVDPQTDIINFSGGSGVRVSESWTGQLVEDGFDLTYTRPYGLYDSYRCIAKLRLADPSQLTGQLDCVIKDRDMVRNMDGASRAVIPVRLRLS